MQQDQFVRYSDLVEGNRYIYAAADPINSIDPFGTSIFTKAFKKVKKVVTTRRSLRLYATVEAGLYTAASASIAVGGTAACVAGTAGLASAACAGIAVTAGTAAAGGAYVTYREGRELVRGE
jgi:hypothetical protein